MFISKVNLLMLHILDHSLLLQCGRMHIITLWTDSVQFWPFVSLGRRVICSIQLFSACGQLTSPTEGLVNFVKDWWAIQVNWTPLPAETKFFIINTRNHEELLVWMVGQPLSSHTEVKELHVMPIIIILKCAEVTCNIIYRIARFVEVCPAEW